MSDIISNTLLFLTGIGRQINALVLDASSYYNWLILAFIAFAIFLIGATLGRTKILISMLCLYVAGFLETRFYSLFHQTELFKNFSNDQSRIIVYLFFYLLSFVILNRSILRGRLILKDVSFSWVLLLSFLNLGLLLSILANYIPFDGMPALIGSIFIYFESPIAQFIWAVLPLLIVIFLKGKQEKK